MKLITAIIQETQLEKVHEALINAEIYRITVSRVSGHGQQVHEEVYRGQKVIPSLIDKVRLDIAVNDEFLEPAVDAIILAAQSDDSNPSKNGKTHETGEVGDGKIFITRLEECIRIRTGERGGKAI